MTIAAGAVALNKIYEGLLLLVLYKMKERTYPIQGVAKPYPI